MLVSPLTLTRLCRDQRIRLLADIGDPGEGVSPCGRNSQDLGAGKSFSTSPIGLEGDLVGKFRRDDTRDRTRTSPNSRRFRRVVSQPWPVVRALEASSRPHPRGMTVAPGCEGFLTTHSK